MQLMCRDTVYNENGSWFTSDTLIHIREYKEVIAHDLVKLKPTLDPDGTGMLYWYVSITGDTVALSRELTTFEYQLPKMILPIRDSDTIAPNANVYPAATDFVPYYPVHCNPDLKPNDNAFHAAMFPVIVFITVSFFYRMVIGGHWEKLKSDLRNAWNPTSTSRSV